YHVTGAPMDGSAVDNHNREVFEEMYKIIKMAWTQETIRYKGKYYEIPCPYEEGIRRWPVGKTWTAKYGAPGEVAADGFVQRVCGGPTISPRSASSKRFASQERQRRSRKPTIA